MDKSTNKVEVVPIVMEDHPNADALSIVRVFGGYTVCIRTANWEGVEKGAYIPPDSLVNTDRPEFAFLAKEGQEDPWVRIKAMRLRQIMSMGLMVPAPEGSVEGDNVADILDVKHYEPPLQIRGGDAIPGPSGVVAYKYDVDTARKYHNKFRPGELVNVTEKIHGANARYVYVDGQQYCGSRTQWKKESDKCGWWQAFRHHPEIGNFCRANPGVVLYGEIYGQVQDLRYDVPNGIRFAAFDILDRGVYLGVRDFWRICHLFNIPTVPEVNNMPFNWEKIQELAEGQSLIASHVREGVVIKPLEERVDDEIGRVILKVVGNGYLTRKEK